MCLFGSILKSCLRTPVREPGQTRRLPTLTRHSNLLPMETAEKESVIKNLALLKRNAMAAPYEKAFAAQKEGADSPMMVVKYRENEAIYIKGMADRVTVVFSTEFKEEEDRIFGKVFLQVRRA